MAVQEETGGCRGGVAGPTLELKPHQPPAPHCLNCKVGGFFPHVKCRGVKLHLLIV